MAITDALQAWVTIAQDDWSALKALVLNQSIRRNVTTKKFVILIGPHVTHEMTVVLEQEFDAVIQLSNESVKCHPELFMFLQLWKIPLVEKCVFVHADHLALQSCDDLFNLTSCALPKAGQGQDGQEIGMIVFKPCVKFYRKLLTITQNGELNSLKHLFEFLEMDNHFENIVPGHYTVWLHPENPPKLQWTSIRMARMTSVKPWDRFVPTSQFSEPGEPFTKSCCDLWVRIFGQDILKRLQEVKIIKNFQKVSLPKSMECISWDPSLDMTPIAIVGHACRYPGGNTPDEFWETLVSGRDLCVLSPRMDMSKEKNPIPAHYLTCPVDMFDAKFFGIAPREAVFIDPQQRILLETAWEALENSGINPLGLKDSTTGVFVGMWTQDYLTMLQDNMTESDVRAIAYPRTYLGNAFSATAARISYTLGLNGPNLLNESGCSSALVSLHLAMESLWRKECDLAMAGGVNLIFRKLVYAEAVAHVLAKDGRCKTFDESADGFGRGEGCAVLVLKRLPDAIRDGDNILSLIRGAAVTQEGTTSSFGTPSKHCQEEAIRHVLGRTGIKAEEISYVETHGTGTAVGDPIEVSAVQAAYGNVPRDEPLILSSVKTNVGHTESVAGLTGVMKVTLALQNEMIPAHRHLKNLNPYIDLDSIPAKIPMEAVPWTRVPGKPRMAGVNSFGMSGTNVHVIVQEAPLVTKPEKAMPPRQEGLEHLLTLSAKTELSLDALIEKYQQLFLQKKSQLRIEDVCFTANSGRAQLPIRMAVVGKNLEALRVALDKKEYTASKSATKPKIAMMFTGQGSQYIGMAQGLYQVEPVFKSAMDHCSLLLKNNLSHSILDVMWAGLKDASGQILLDQTQYSQTAIFCVEYSLLQLWKSLGIKPDVVLGHSVGEFAAAVAAGIISVEDGLKLASERAKLIQKLPSGGLVAVRSQFQGVKLGLKKLELENPGLWFDIAALNTQDEGVIAGPEAALDKLIAWGQNNGIGRMQRLAAGQAFHSRDMDKILEEYKKVTCTIKHHAPTCAYVSGWTGQVVTPEEINGSYWLHHVRDPVNFRDGIKTVWELGAKTFVEIGSQPILLALGMSNLSSEANEAVWVPSLRKLEPEAQWSNWLTNVGRLWCSGVDMTWTEMYEQYNVRKVLLPNYPWQRQRYWFEEKAGLGGDLMTFSGKGFHPLIGRQLPLVSSKTHFHCAFSCDTLPFLADHMVMDKVILPGAGFLEMVLAAGHATAVGAADMLVRPTQTIKVDQFSVEAALEVPSGGGSCRIQVKVVPIVEEESKGGFQVTVYNQDLDYYTSTWRKHAEGRFQFIQSNSKRHDLEEIKVRCSGLTMEMKNIYGEILSTQGVNLQGEFQSLGYLWKGDNEALAQIVLSQDPNEYICHPIVLDALIQAMAVSKVQEKNKENVKGSMYLPVGVEEFIIYPHDTPKEFYAFLQTSESGGKSPNTVSATLLNEKGHEIAIIKNVSFVLTSPATFLNALTSGKKNIPSILVEECRPHGLGYLQQRQELIKMPGLKDIYNSMSTRLSELAQAAKDSEKFIVIITDVCLHYYMNALLELGWNPEVGDDVTGVDIVNELNILPKYTRYVEYMLNMMAEVGRLSELEESDGIRRWRVTRPFDLVQVKGHLHQLDEEASVWEGKNMIEYKLPNHVGRNLPAILSGKVPAMSIMFDKEVNAEAFYYEQISVRDTNSLIPPVLERLFSKGGQEEVKQGDVDSVPILRILEVGAGTGSTTMHMLEALTSLKCQYLYTYTDVSRHFLSGAATRFASYKSKMEFKIFDIEKDGKEQGFAPHDFDIIVASNVIHATKDLVTTLANLRQLTAPGGYLLGIELSNRARVVDFCFGTLEGYWRFTDTHLRRNSPIADVPTWDTVMKKAGFENIESRDVWPGGCILLLAKAGNELFQSRRPGRFSTLDDRKTWLIVGDDNEMTRVTRSHLSRVHRRTVLVTDSKTVSSKGSGDLLNVDMTSKESISNLLGSLKDPESDLTKFEGILYTCGLSEKINQEAISQGILHLTQALIEGNVKVDKIIIVTSGVINTGGHPVPNPAAGTLRGLMKVLRLEFSTTETILVDLDPLESSTEMNVRHLLSRIWSNDEELEVAIRGGKLFKSRLTIQDNFPSPLLYPKGERYEVVLPESRSFGDMRFELCSTRILEKDEVEVQVKATALNFRDLLVILKPEGYTTNWERVGLELSGIVTGIGPNVTKVKVGDHVCGFTAQGALSSHTIALQDALTPINDQVTWAEAATMPVAFFTAAHCLYTIAQVSTKDTVLIHVASGGVGLAAIQIARKFGARIVATAGSSRKRAYLKNLGIEHVYHSRNLSFGADIERDLGSRPITVVLNSLTGPGFKETTLKICADNARFVEIGRINIWKKEEVAVLRPDVTYTIANLEVDDLSPCAPIVEEGIRTGSLRPLPYHKFHASQAPEAFMYFSKANHIGKIVITLPQIELDPTSGKLEHKETYFNANATYLITGGLGGIGLEVTKWMAKTGAKHVILVGRRPPSEQAKQLIDSLNEGGRMDIRIVPADVGNKENLKHVLDYIKAPGNSLPPLRGIVHSAGALADSLIMNQSWDKFLTTYRAKVDGTWNLHEMTKNEQLEHFILFSSAASTLGSGGQSNHSAANAFMDTFATYRHSLGLPALTINWGIWGEVGVAADMALGKEGGFGIKPFSPTKGMNALAHGMRHQSLQIAVVEMGDFSQFRHAMAHMNKYVEEMGINEAAALVAFDAETRKAFWKEMKKTPNEGRAGVVKALLEKTLRITLKLPENEEIDENQRFQDMGMDSLMGVEMRNRLQDVFGKMLVLNPTALMDHTTLESLSTYIAEQTFNLEIQVDDDAEDERANMAGKAVSSSNQSDSQDIRALMLEDCKLPENVKDVGGCVQATNVSHIFLTGATGVLGPYLLYEILSQNPKVAVTCLLRGKSLDKAISRLKDIVKSKGKHVDWTRVQFVLGNVADKQLGLDNPTYKNLTESVDQIIHLATKVNHLETYRKVVTSLFDIRSVNVLGTKNILELATTFRTKRVLYPSSFSIVTKTDSDGFLEENLPEDEDMGEELKSGYMRSKFVCEKLMKEAIQRGVPVIVARYASLVNDSVSGQFSIDKNQFMTFFMTCVKLKVFLKEDRQWYTIGVDIAANVTAQLLCSNKTTPGAYNVNNPHQGHISTDEMSQEFCPGACFRKATQEEFASIIQKEAKDSNDPLLTVLSSALDVDGHSDFGSVLDVPATKLAYDNTREVYRESTRLLQVIPNVYKNMPSAVDLFRSAARYAIKVGMDTSMGIQLTDKNMSTN